MGTLKTATSGTTNSFIWLPNFPRVLDVWLEQGFGVFFFCSCVSDSSFLGAEIEGGQEKASVESKEGCTFQMF